MKSYEEKVKAVKEEIIQVEIKGIEERLRNLNPWNYIMCGDGIPRIGMEWGEELFDEVKEYFTRSGLVVEESKIYVPNKVSKSKLYEDIILRLAKYAYVKYSSNWPTLVNKIVRSTYESKVCIEPTRILQNKGSELDFEDIQRGLEKLQTLWYDSEKDQYELISHWSPRCDDFFYYQGFDFTRDGYHVLLPKENTNNNGVIRYCYEQIHDHIAEKLLEKVEKCEKSCSVNINIKGSLPDSIVDSLISDGFIVRHYRENVTISLW